MFYSNQINMRPWTLWGQPGSTVVYYKLYSESKQLEGTDISMWSGAFKQEHRYIFAPYEECSLTRCHLETKDSPHTHRNKIYGAAFAFSAAISVSMWLPCGHTWAHMNGSFSCTGHNRVIGTSKLLQPFEKDIFVGFIRVLPLCFI